jgi:hypothetical protein
LESPDEQEELASYLKDREAEGVKSVHFYFPNDLDASTQTTNHMVIDLAGFSGGVAAFDANRRSSVVFRRGSPLRSRCGWQLKHVHSDRILYWVWA